MGRCDPFTHYLQISVELSIIERTQFDPERLLPLSHATGKSEEGHEPVPRRVGIRCWKIPFAHPHAQIRQRQLQYGHALVFSILQLVHRPFPGFQLGQSTQEVALFQTVARVLGFFSVFPIPHPLIAPPARVQVRIGLSLHGFDHGLVLEAPLALITPIMFTDIAIDAPIEGVPVGFGLQQETLGKPGGTLGAFVGLGRPALDVRQAALEGLPALGDFGVLDGRFRKPVIRIY